MMLIGIDPHKSTHTATAIAPDTNHEAASIRIDATLREYRRMLTWARRWPQRRWAVENAEGLGRRGHRYYKSKIAEGKTPREAPRASRDASRPPLADHDQRRTAAGRSGRTTGDDSAIQRGWSNPNDQLFGQVTSRTRQPRLYDGQPSRLTNTEAPKSTDLSGYHPDYLAYVAAELNDRPRKRLGVLPTEVDDGQRVEVR